jgi:hypothetical protein
LESLKTVHPDFWTDSLFYNDTIYPNIFSEIRKTETWQFSFEQLDSQLDNIVSILFRIVTSNGYPTDCYVQVYFLDNNQFPVDTLFSDGMHRLAAAPTNSDGVVTEPRVEITDVPMPESFINDLTNIQFVRIESIIATKIPGIRMAKFYTRYELGVHIGARIEFLFNNGG